MVVIALGENALVRRGQPPADVQRKNARLAVKALSPVVGRYRLVLAHANGPQVGLLALQAAAYAEVEPCPLDLLVAQTQSMIG